MKTADPYLNFAGNTEEAFEFYKSVFGGEFLSVIRFRDFGDNSMGVPEKDLDKIAHIALPLGPNDTRATCRSRRKGPWIRELRAIRDDWCRRA